MPQRDVVPERYHRPRAAAPPATVEVLRDGTWRPGLLEAVRREPDGRWRGLTTSQAADPLQRHHGWHGEGEVRARD